MNSGDFCKYLIPLNFEKLVSWLLNIKKGQILSLNFQSYYFSIKDPAAGNSQDWYKGVLKARFVYTVELRDTGFHGFVLPAYQIIPRLLKSGFRLIALLWIFELPSKSIFEIFHYHHEVKKDSKLYFINFKCHLKNMFLNKTILWWTLEIISQSQKLKT